MLKKGLKSINNRCKRHIYYNQKPLIRKTKSNQIFHYTRCNTPKRVTSWRGPSPRHCAQATQLLSKKCRSGGEPLATLCPIWPAQDLNLRPPSPETNALPLDQLAGLSENNYCKKFFFFFLSENNYCKNKGDSIRSITFIIQINVN